MRPSLQHRLEAVLLRGVEGALAGLGARASRRVGARIGALVRAPLGIRAGVVEENLRRAFPDADDAWIDRVAREAYRHLGREAVAMLRLSTLDPSRVREIVDIPPYLWAELQEALTLGRGALLVTGHYGNWEMAAAAVAARGVPISAIVKRQSNPLVNDRIESARRDLGIETIDMGEAPRKVPRALLSGRTVGIVADQDARRSGIWVPFFGVPASTHRGPALFALRLGTPLFTAVVRALPDGRYALSGRRIPVEPTDDFEADVERLTATIAGDLEREIRADPTQYFWFHKRWKTPKPEEPAPPLPGTNSRDAEDRDRS